MEPNERGCDCDDYKTSHGDSGYWLYFRFCPWCGKAAGRPEPTAGDREAAKKLTDKICGDILKTQAFSNERWDVVETAIADALSVARGDERKECELGNALSFANQQTRIAEARCLKDATEAKVKALEDAAMYLATLNGNIQEKKHDPYGYEYFMGDGKQGLNVWVSAREIWSARKALGRNPVNNAAQLEVE